MREKIEIGYQTFVSDGEAELGAIREVHSDSVVVYAETQGIFAFSSCAHGGALKEGDLRR